MNYKEIEEKHERLNQDMWNLIESENNTLEGVSDKRIEQIMKSKAFKSLHKERLQAEKKFLAFDKKYAKELSE